MHSLSGQESEGRLIIMNNFLLWEVQGKESEICFKWLLQKKIWSLLSKALVVSCEFTWMAIKRDFTRNGQNDECSYTPGALMTFFPCPFSSLAEKMLGVKFWFQQRTQQTPLCLQKRGEPKVWEMGGSKPRTSCLNKQTGKGCRGRETKAQRADLCKSLLSRRVQKSMFNFSVSQWSERLCKPDWVSCCSESSRETGRNKMMKPNAEGRKERNA